MGAFTKGELAPSQVTARRRVTPQRRKPDEQDGHSCPSIARDELDADGPFPNLTNRDVHIRSPFGSSTLKKTGKSARLMHSYATAGEQESVKCA